MTTDRYPCDSERYRSFRPSTRLSPFVKKERVVTTNVSQRPHCLGHGPLDIRADEGISNNYDEIDDIGVAPLGATTDTDSPHRENVTTVVPDCPSNDPEVTTSTGR